VVRAAISARSVKKEVHVVFLGGVGDAFAAGIIVGLIIGWAAGKEFGRGN
jgi:hypothetical protein